jgi:ATP-binding cassette subfamily C protein CydD
VGAVSLVDRRLITESRAARRQLMVTVLFGVLAAALILAQAGLLATVIVDASTGRPLVAIRGDLLALLVVICIRSGTALASETTALRTAATLKTGLRARMVGHALRLGPGWLGGRRSGELTTLATRGLDTLDPYFARFLPQVALALIVPPVVLVRIGMADWISALILVLTVPLIPVFMVLIGLHTRRRTARQWRLLAHLGGHFLDVVEGWPTLKVFGRAKAQAAVIRRITDQHRQATMATLRVAFLSALVLELLATVGTALVAVAVGLRLLSGSLGYSTALLVLLLAPEAYLPLRALGTHFHSSMEGVAAAQQAFAVLDEPLPPTGEQLATGVPVDLQRDAVEFRGVSLTYPGRSSAAVLAVDLRVEAGSRTVLVGESGSGKSSLLALLLRFEEPTAGQIWIGGRRLADLAIPEWRREIAWVSQTPYLFAGTLRENLRLGSPDASDSALWEGLDLAGARQFVRALPDGLGTRVGERGLRLSAGQRQRMALARAFLRDAPLLLLDEPTAHLDPITAAALRTAVERLMSGRTVLLVTHHRAWLDHADAVVTVHNGQLAPAPVAVLT